MKIKKAEDVENIFNTVTNIEKNELWFIYREVNVQVVMGWWWTIIYEMNSMNKVIRDENYARIIAILWMFKDIFLKFDWMEVFIRDEKINSINK